jgi:hypothetical protein
MYALLGCYAVFCVVIGGALGYNSESVWILLVFIVAGVVGFQVGFFAGLLIQG